jgi:D-3-phosphoglycerate dehydrogenase
MCFVRRHGRCRPAVRSLNAAAGGHATAGSPHSPVRVVVLDPIPPDEWSYDVEAAAFAARGAELVLPASRAAARRGVRDADVVIVTGIDTLDAPTIATLRRCVGILCYSIGMDKVDGAAAAARGIPVRNVPDYCTDEVSDHALTLLLAAERRLTTFVDLAAHGRWDAEGRPENASIRRLRGQTLGIIGVGRIGRKVARKARAFGFRTIAFDPYVSSTDDEEIELLPLPDVLGQADALVLCASLTETSRGMLGLAEFSQVRPGVILVNVARGALIDEHALAEALRSGRVGFAAVDVRSPEPPARDADPLAGLPNVIQTPHIAALSWEAFEDIKRMAGDIVIEMLESAGRIPAARVDQPA